MMQLTEMQLVQGDELHRLLPDGTAWRILSLNVNGGLGSAGDTPKGYALSKWLQESKTSVVGLQETHELSQWAAPGTNYMVVSDKGERNARGAALLLSRNWIRRIGKHNAEAEIKTTSMGCGRGIRARIPMGPNHGVDIVSLYAPNEEGERQRFVQQMAELMRDAHPAHTVVMGDLNEPSGSIHAWLQEWGLETTMRSLDVETQIPTYIAPRGKRPRAIDWIYVSREISQTSVEYVLPTATIT